MLRPIICYPRPIEANGFALLDLRQAGVLPRLRDASGALAATIGACDSDGR